MAKFTTIGVGGPADILVVAGNSRELISVIELALDSSLPFKLIGRGSNLIVSDNGYRGMIIVNRSKGWEIINKPARTADFAQTGSRFTGEDKNSLYNLKENKTSVLVKVASGNRIPILIKELFKEGISGLEWFTGIPGTIGGAVYMNIHGADTFLGDLVVRARLFSGKEIKEVENSYFRFKYDWCILHETHEHILDVDLRLNEGMVDEARKQSHDWARYKANQPQKSAGCIFQNLTGQEMDQLKIPTPSVGYVIDKLLHLKGTRQGNAMISVNHAAFIENLGGASATDVINLIELISQRAKKELGINLKKEVEII